MGKVYDFFVQLGSFEIPPDFLKFLVGFGMVVFSVSVIFGVIGALRMEARAYDEIGEKDD